MTALGIATAVEPDGQPTHEHLCLVGSEPEPCRHSPGVIMAPVFALPGRRSSVCRDCGRAISSTGAGQPWTTI